MAETKLTPGEGLRAGFNVWLFSVYRRPLRFLFVILVLPLAIIIAATHQSNVGLARRQALLNLRMTAKVAAEAVQATLDRAVLFSELVSHNPSFLEAFSRRDAAAIKTAVEQSLPLLPDADQVVVTDAAGLVVAAVGEGAPLLGADLSHDEIFRGVREGNGRAYVSAIGLRDEESFEKVVHVAVPISGAEQPLGLFVIEYRIESVRLWVQHVRVEPEGFIYAVDHHSQLVVYPYQVLPGKPKVVSDWAPVAQALPADGFSIDFHDKRIGRRWLAGVYPIGNTGWRVVAVQPDDAVLRVLYQIFLPLGVLVIFLLGLVLYVSVRWAALQALNLRLLQQNATLLKQSQQRWTLEQGKDPKGRQGGVST